MRRVSARPVLTALILALSLVSGCAAPQKQSVVFDGTFNTVTKILGYGDAFAEDAANVRTRTEELHRLFDIYQNYDGLNNAKTINDNAGVAPVSVPRELFDMIALGVEWHGRTGGKLNIALGPVLRLWKAYEELGQGRPSPDELRQALPLCDIRDVELDADAQTVFLKKPGMSLDLGAVGKGFASRLALEEAHGAALLNLGGNVVVNGPPPGRAAWSVGIQDPDDSQKSLLTLNVKGGAVVTSGDYQRYTIAGDERLGHIIDPDTAEPGALYRSVTLIGPDAAICDILSTALFLLPFDEGRRLAEEVGCEAIWVLPSREIIRTDNQS